MFIYYLSPFFILSNAFAQSGPPVDFKNRIEYKNDAGQSCISNIQSCSLRIDPDTVSKLKGEKGNSGPKGDKGEQGRCLPGDRIEDYTLSFEKYCMGKEDGERVFLEFGEETKIEAFCKTTEPLICLVINNVEAEPRDYSTEEYPFWLGHKSVTKIYEAANVADHILRIRERTREMKLTFQYDCYNSAIVHENRTDKSLRFLTWTDRLVGPEKSADNPFNYVVQNDECSNYEESGNMEKWMKAFITLEGPSHSLPIADIQVRDINERSVILKQTFRLRLQELCFA